MKPSRFILASFLALAFAGMASAQTVIHITGSTAFRAAAHAAIQSILASGYTYGYSGTTGIGSASQAIFTGTTSTSVEAALFGPVQALSPGVPIQ